MANRKPTHIREVRVMKAQPYDPPQLVVLDDAHALTLRSKLQDTRTRKNG
jgi:hypothetical protein